MSDWISLRWCLEICLQMLLYSVNLPPEHNGIPLLGNAPQTARLPELLLPVIRSLLVWAHMEAFSLRWSRMLRWSGPSNGTLNTGATPFVPSSCLLRNVCLFNIPSWHYERLIAPTLLVSRYKSRIAFSDQNNLIRSPSYETCVIVNEWMQITSVIMKPSRSGTIITSFKPIFLFRNMYFRSASGWFSMKPKLN